jgi:hypothetical protein
MSYTDEQWPHHCMRMQRIREAGLYDDYSIAFLDEYDRRIPDPHAVGNDAEAVISDECRISASAEVCHRHGLDQYEEEEVE